MANVKADGVVEETAKKVKKFNKTTPIPCKSICTGVLFVEGPVTKSEYMFYDFDDVRDIQHQDLEALVIRNANCIVKPQFIILDEDYIEQNPKIKKIYDSMYTKKDLREILMLPTDEMVGAIEKLPKGAKEAILGLASTMIETGALDSITKVKAIDSIFDTKLIFTTTNS